jgi:hypothetical protein
MKRTIKIKVKKPWEVSKGHSEHRSGSGEHDSRPKRKRTRQAQRSAWQTELIYK